MRVLAVARKQKQGRSAALLLICDPDRVRREGLKTRVGLRGEPVSLAWQDAEKAGAGEVFSAERQGAPMIGPRLGF